MLPADYKQFREFAAALHPGTRRQRTTAEVHLAAVLAAWRHKRWPCVWSIKAIPKLTPRPSFLVDQFASWLAARPASEAAFWLSSAFASWIPGAQRQENAMFFTPPRLAERIIDNLLAHGASLEGQRWHDPAGGGGAFLTPLALRMARYGLARGWRREVIASHVCESLSATELDPVLACLSAEFVKIALCESLGPWNDVDKLAPQVIAANSLKSPTVQRDVIVCNPPYRKLKAEELAAFEPFFGSVIAGQSNLYGLFMAQCIELARPGGLIGLLTPTSFQSGHHFEKLRRHLLKSAELRQIDFIHERFGVFLDVEQNATATVFRRRNQGTGFLTEPTAVTRIERGEVEYIGEAALHSSGPWLFPRRSDDAQLLACASRSGGRLGNYGYLVKVGGYVAYRDLRKTLKAPSSTNAERVFPLLCSGDLRRGRTIKHGTHHSKRGLPLFVKNSVASPRQSVENPCAAIQRLTSADQPHRIVASVVPRKFVDDWGGVIAENHVLLILEAPAQAVKLAPRLLVQLLNSEPIDRVFRALSGVSNVSTFELNNLPLPEPDFLIGLMRSRGLNALTDELIYEAYNHAIASFEYPRAGTVENG